MRCSVPIIWEGATQHGENEAAFVAIKGLRLTERLVDYSRKPVLNAWYDEESMNLTSLLEYTERQ